jgi:hypothetical protein
MPRNVLFVYKGYRFLCTVERERPGRYRPVLVRQLPWPMERSLPLVSDDEWCRTERQALRLAEEQAMKWVDSRTVHATELT